VNGLAEAWRARGRMRTLAGHRIFTVEVPSRGRELHPPLLVLHGFPSSSFDFHRVVDRLAVDRTVVLFDMLGYGLSDKPDRPYTFGLQADIAIALVDEVGTDRLSLLTHDVGDTVGGELLARNLEGGWPVEITERVLTNGSVYMRWAQLSHGQRFLLDLPDHRLVAGSGPDRDTVVAGITATFSPGTVVRQDELSAQWEMIAHLDGHLLLPRLIRYVEERRLHEERFTGAIERHPSPLTVVWGRDDPIAVVTMAEALADLDGVRVHVLDGVGHYPMLEAPDRFLDALSHSR
jgi:pimeloyl-ACP methyl ester carboxylesterase